jgi:hypothetical protein
LTYFDTEVDIDPVATLRGLWVESAKRHVLIGTIVHGIVHGGCETRVCKEQQLSLARGLRDEVRSKEGCVIAR